MEQLATISQKHSPYFSHLADAMTRYLSELLKEGSSLFRRGSEVVYGVPTSGTTDFHLYMIGREPNNSEKGTFTVGVNPDRFLVFRNPIKMRVQFLIAGSGLNTATKLKAYDRLHAHFFDQRVIEPFIPSSYQSFPALYEKLRATKAELHAHGNDAHLDPANALDNFQFRFDYVALYHSGNSLREELRAKSRVIDYGNETSERSAL